MKKIFPILLTLVLVSTAGTAQSVNKTQDSTEASPGLVPGNFFYGLENAVEQLEVSIAGMVGGPDLKSKALANNAQERLAEANALADRNQSEKASEMIQKYSGTLNESRSIAQRNNNSELSSELENISSKNTETLERVSEKVPEQAREAIQKAMDRSNKDRAAIDKRALSKRNKTPEGLQNRGGRPEERKSIDPGNLSNRNDDVKRPQSNLSGKSDTAGKVTDDTNLSGDRESGAPVSNKRPENFSGSEDVSESSGSVSGRDSGVSEGSDDVVGSGSTASAGENPDELGQPDLP